MPASQTPRTTYPRPRRPHGALMPPNAPADAGRVAILTVDDDPAVSRAVARDLRRRYGDHYRVVRADSGQSALDALREVKLRGEPGRAAAGRPPDAGDDRRRVSGTRDGRVPRRPARAAHRLRRHRRRHRGDQRRRPRPLPAQALGSAGGEAVSGRRRPAGDVAVLRPPRGPGDRGRRAPLVGAGRPRCASSWPATRCPTAGSPPTNRRAGGCWRRPTRTGSRCRW